MLSNTDVRSFRPASPRSESYGLQPRSELFSQATHNAVLVDLLERLTTHLVHAPHSTLSVGDRWREALAEHARLLDAIS